MDYIQDESYSVGLEVVCGYWTLTWAHGKILQSSRAGTGAETRPSHRLSFVFYNCLTEESGERHKEHYVV